MGCGESDACAIKVVVSSHCRRNICLSLQGLSVWEWSSMSFVHSIFGCVADLISRVVAGGRSLLPVLLVCFSFPVLVCKGTCYLLTI